MTRKPHWENIYQSKSDQELSWHQSNPTTSLSLIQSVADYTASVVDVGGGTSHLVDCLLDSGFSAVTVLDIASAAIERSKSRLGPRADLVRWIVGDVTAMDDIGHCDVWHDRAVFHFLTDEQDRRHYVRLAERTLSTNSHLVQGTFGLGGPPRCSGLDVRRYDARLMQVELGNGFALVKELIEIHTTPWGKLQQFCWGVFRRL